MDTVKITSAITGNDPGLVYPVLWKQKSVKVEKGRIRTIRGEKEMMRGTVDSTQEGNRKMRSYLKILIATVLVGIACLAGAKEVKAETFSYIEDSYTITWETSENVAYVKIGESTPVAATGTSHVFSAAEIKAAIGDSFASGNNSLTVKTLQTDQTTEVASGSVDVPGYDDSLITITENHGTIEDVSPEAGLKGETYSATWVQDDGYVLEKWNDGSTSATRTDLVFGTAYTITTKAVAFGSISGTSLVGKDPGNPQTLTITLNPSSADPAFLTYDLTDFANCEAEFESVGNQISFDNVSGNGTFVLDIYYDNEVIKSQKITVSTTIESMVILGEPSMQVWDEETYELEILPAAAAAGAQIAWSVSNSNVVDYDLNADSTITLIAKKEGYTNLTAKVGTKSTTVRIDVVEDEDVETVEIVSGPVEVVAGKTGTYKAKVTLSNGKASKYGVAWSVDDPTVATITSTDKLTGKLTAKKEGYVTVRATAIGDPTMYDEIDVEIVDKIEVGTLIYKAADGSDTITFTKPYESGKYKLDLSWGKGVTSDHPDASVKSISYTTVPAKTDVGSFSGSVFTPKKAGTIEVIPTVTYTDGEKEECDSFFITVEDDDWTTKLSTGGSSNSSSVSSDYYIGFKLENDEVYSSYDPKYDLKELTGYRVEVLKDGKVLAGKTVTPSSFSVGETYKISKDTLEDLLEDASGDLSGDSTTVTFRVSPYGTNLDDGKAYATSAARTLERTVYKNGSTYYLTKSSSSSSSSSMKSSSAQGSGSGSDYDKVPKTGEGNTRLLIIMIAVISATIAGSILLSNLPVRSKSGADESVDDKDVFHKKD